MDLNLPEDYALTDGEIDNIVYLTCRYTVGWGMRSCDKSVCEMMLGNDKTGSKCVERLLQITCEYVWDHICGEPEDPSVEKFVAHMEPLIQEWWSNSTQEERSKTE
jgi:hypothetical protein